jgi:hypothetical protein
LGVEYETMEVGKCWTIYFHKGEYPQPGEVRERSGRERKKEEERW